MKKKKRKIIGPRTQHHHSSGRFLEIVEMWQPGIKCEKKKREEKENKKKKNLTRSVC